MSEAKPPRAAKPGTLLSQWWTLGTIVRDKRASGRHVKVAWVIIDRYRQDHGSGRASLRYIEAFTGLNRHAVVQACRELTAWGYVEQRRGGGTRPSEYVPSWVTVRGSGVETLTTKPENPSGVEMLPSVVSKSTPLDATSGAETLPESFLHEPADKPASLKEEIDCGLATPDAAGLAPASPAAPQEGGPTFESLWRAYAYNRGKKEAKAAWNALPVEVDRAAVIRAASEWQASWAAQGKPDAPRFTLARWLKDERFDEDAPRGFQKVGRPATAKQKPASPAKPASPVTARITAAEVVEAGGITSLRFTTDAGNEAHVVVLEHPNEDAQSEGQRELKNLVYAVGLQQIDDSGELLGRTVKLVGGEERFAAPDSRPDDDPPPPARPEPARYANPDPQPAPTPLPSAPSDWPEWMDAEYEDGDAA